MRTGYSRTAEGMALVRAMERAVPASRRILDDPYSSAFLKHGFMRAIGNSHLLSRVVLRLVDRWAPGGQEYLAIRGRLTIDEVTEFFKRGGTQIVLLGAGFDTLALRFRDNDRLMVFEVDHPATQEIKHEVLRSFTVPANLRLVPIDFEKDNLVAVLRSSGFDSDEPALALWLGVTFYLTPESAEHSFMQLHSLLAPGSRVFFDYLLSDIVDGTSANVNALEKARRVAQLGEPWLFGLDPSALNGFLTRFGFRMIKEFTPDELKRRYAPSRTRPMDYFRMVLCERM